VVVQGQEIAYRTGFGTTSVEDGGTPVTPETLFPIGSTSKTVNALMIMRLVEQGALDLDRPVVDYLPGYVFTDNPTWGRAVTLRHTSGLVQGFKAWGARDADALRRYVWDEMAHFALLAEPGRATYYANGPCLAGHVAEVATGKFYAQLVEEEVFAPLGMLRSTYDRRVAMTYPLALPHDQDEDGNLVTIHHYADSAAHNPDGLCLSTADDLASVLVVLLNQGCFHGQQYLSAESAAAMQTPYGDYQFGTRNHVGWAMLTHEGLGLNIGHYKGVRVVGHGGALHSFRTKLDLFPERGIGVVCLTNWCDFAERIEMLFGLYDQLLDTPSSYHFPQPSARSGDAREAAWGQFEGSYLAPSGGLVTVEVTDQKLTITIDEETRILTALNAEEYTFEDDDGLRAAVSFLAEASGRSQTVYVNGDLYRRCDLDWTAAPGAATLVRYEGLYASFREGDVIDGFYVRVEEDSLYLFPAEHQGLRIALDRSKGVKCTALGPTRFVCDRGLYDFRLGSDGAVCHVTRDLALRYWPAKDT